MDVRSKVRVVTDSRELALAATSEVLRHAREAIDARACFRIALAGGSTPRALYAELAEHGAEQGADFSRWQVFFGDERCVPPDHPESNFRTAREALLAHVLIPRDHVYRVRTEVGRPNEVANAYASEIRRAFDLAPGEMPRFDLALLGLGTDGHTASLFPETSALEETERIAVENFVPRLDAHRITLTIPVFNAAHAVLFLVEGKDKAPALHAVLESDITERDCPAKSIAPSDGSLQWLVDRAAGAELATVRQAT